MPSLIYSSGITGADLETGRVSQDLDQQFDAAFQSMRALVERAGATLANIAHVTFFLKDLRDRAAINRPWLEMFPDEDDQAYVGAIDAPWRQTFPEEAGRPILNPMVVSLPGPQVRLEFIASLPGE